MRFYIGFDIGDAESIIELAISANNNVSAATMRLIMYSNLMLRKARHSCKPLIRFGMIPQKCRM